MIKVEIPSRGATVEFPDGTSEDVINNSINEAFPRNGEDVAYAFSQDPSFGTTISSSDYKLFEDYMKSKPSIGFSGWAGAIIEGGRELVSQTAKGLGGLASEPGKAVANVIEATGVGTVGLKNLLTQSTDPDSVFFKAKDLLTGGGTAEDRRLQFIEAANALVRQQKVARGEDTVLMPRGAINPETTQGLSNITDITMLIPGLNVAGFGAKAGSKIVGGALKATGKTLKGVARGAEVVGDVAKSILRRELGPDIEQAMAQAASVGARVPLSGEAQGVYRALTLAGREGGQLLDDIGGQVGLPGRLGPLERVAASETATPLTKTLAIAGKKIGGDFILDISPRIVGGAIEGATIGGVLGGLSAGEEGAAQGIGGGIAIGALGGGIGRLGERFFGAKRNQDVAADFDRAVGSSGLDEIGIQRVTRMVSEAQKAGVDMRAQMADFLNEAARNNVKVSFVNDSDKPSILKDITGQDVPSVKFKGVTVEGLLSTGEKDGQIHVLLNTDRMDTTTAFHELFEALVMRQVDQNALDLAGREIFGELQGESPEGFTLQKDPQVKPEQVVEFVNQYTKHLEDKEVKAIYENAVALLRDENAPLDQRKKARAFLTRELLAYRTGAKAEGGKNGYQDVFLSGRIPTFLDNAFDRSKKRAAKNAAVDSALDFSEGIEPAFRDEKGNLRPAPTADGVINKILDIKTSLDPEEVVGAIPATPENIAKLEALGIDPKRVRKSGGKVKVVDAKPISKAEVQDVINTPATPEEKAAGVGDVTLDGESFVYSRGLSDAQMEKLRAKIPANQFRMLKQINDALKMGRDAEGSQTLPIFEATHVPEKPTYEGIPVSTRNKLIYSVEFNKKGQIYFRVLDVLSAKGNLDKMFKRGKFRDAYESPKQAYQDLIGRYLGNLDSVSPKDSATVLGDGNLALGEKRRNLLNAALRFWKADTYFNLPDAELVSMMKAGGEQSVKSMRNDRMLYMRPTGEVSTFRLDAYNLGKRNYQPDTVGTKRVLKGQDGSNIIEGTKGWRAYSPSGSLDGVFGTIEEAIKAIGRRRDKDQGPTKADLMLKVQDENANLADIAEQKSNLKQSTFSDLINIPGMSPETTKQVLATVFEYDRVLDQYRRRMVNKVVVEEAKSRLPGAPLLSKVRDYIQLAEKRATQSSLEYKKNIERLERADRLARENIEKITEQMPDAERRDLIRRINQSKTVRVPQQTLAPRPSMYAPKGIQEQEFVPQ